MSLKTQSSLHAAAAPSLPDRRRRDTVGKNIELLMASRFCSLSRAVRVIFSLNPLELRPTFWEHNIWN